MSQYTVAADGAATKNAEQKTGVGFWLTSALDILVGDKTKAMTNDDARKGALVLAGASAIGAGYYTRSRALAGKEAIAGFLF